MTERPSFKFSFVRIDVETFSEVELKRAGAYRYAEDESTELLCLCYSFGGPVHLWVPHESLPEKLLKDLIARVKPSETGTKIYIQLAVPTDLREHLERGGKVKAFNAQFERVILNGTAGRKLGFPKLKIDQMYCTQAKSKVMGMQNSLGEVAKSLETYPKNEHGRADMLALSKPRSGKERRYTPQNAPDRFVNLYAYCIDDVRAEAGVDDALPDMTDYQQATYWLDQRVNDRGWAVDMESIANVKYLVRTYREELATLCWDLTGLEPTQREKIADWVRANGYPQLLDMKAETVKEIVAGSDCPENCKTVLKIFSTYGMKAVSKFDTIEDMVCKDGRLHGMFQYHGANTGRWSSTGVQLQNLFRPVIDDADVAIEAFRLRSLEWIRFLYPGIDPMKVFASCVRGMLVPGEGKELMFLDFAGVESRGNAWLWGEEWKLKAFRDYDAGIGPDMYKVVYGRAFNVDPATISKKDPRRQHGKVMDLGFGFEGGVNALMTMADTYGVDLYEMAELVWDLLPDDVLRSAQWMWEKFGRGHELPQKVFMAADGVKQLWRLDHPNTVAGWKELKAAAALAIRHPGKVFKCANGKLMFSVREHGKHKWLQLRLPSGRRISYFKPSLDTTHKCNKCKRTAPYPYKAGDACLAPGCNDGKLYIADEVIRYWGVDTETRRWMNTATYGGKLDENADQGLCADHLIAALFALEDAGYLPIGSVHDEGITEIDEGFGSIEDASARMCVQREWAKGFPLAVEGNRAKRYSK